MNITIYDTNKESSGCGCSCSCNSESAFSRDDLIRDLEAKAQNSEVKSIIIEDQNRQELISDLNDIFKSNNERITVNKSTLDFTLSKILPLIVVDGKIRCANSIPDADELLEAEKSDSRVIMKSSCC